MRPISDVRVATMTHADAGQSLEVHKEPLGPPTRGGEFHIPSLDGIRALSFMLVFVAHAGLGAIVPGGFGVTIFFFLSGYLITTLLRLEHSRTSHNSLRDFYLRRLFRIFPPFYTVLALALSLTALGLLPEALHFGSVLSQLAHATNYYFIFQDERGFPSGTVVYWSLAVEEHFYLVFPWIFILLQRGFPEQPRRQAFVLLALCALALCWRFILVFAYDARMERIYMGSDTRVDSILFGCVLALLGNPMFDPWRGSKALWTKALLPAGFGLLILSLTYRAAWFRETLRYSLQGLGLIPLFVVAIRYPEWGPVRLLNMRLVKRVGLLSYSLYLSHDVILSALHHRLPSIGPVLSGVLAFGLSLLVANAVLHWVERPSAHARKAWVQTTWLRPTSPQPVRPPAAQAQDTTSFSA